MVSMASVNIYKWNFIISKRNNYFKDLNIHFKNVFTSVLKNLLDNGNGHRYNETILKITLK